MEYRKLIYPFTGLLMLPAVLILASGSILVPMIVLIELPKGHIQSLVYLIAFVGGVLGLFSAAVMTCDIAGDRIFRVNPILTRIGIFIGVASEAWAIAHFQPKISPLLYYWTPPLLAGLILIILSFGKSANK